MKEQPGNVKELYNASFFAGTADVSIASAREVVPLLLDLVRPRSVVDVGCGLGGWLAAFRDEGITDIAGVDGDYVSREQLFISSDHFFAQDLSQGVGLNRTFDLAISLEVGEHLPKSSARGFVESLTRLAPVVAFSAAVPGQGGVSHINEQWPEYWAGHFAACGYVAVDAVRHRVWNDDAIVWHYRQNLMLYVKKERLTDYPALARDHERLAGLPLSIVHPKMYEGLLFHSNPANVRVMDAAHSLSRTVKAAVGRRIGRKRGGA
jgi:SAM-dependent methyltransferase